MPISCGPKPEFCDGGTREEERCHRRIRSAQGGGEGVRSVWQGARQGRMLACVRSAFVSCLIRNATKLALVQSEVCQFAVRQRTQFAQRVAVHLAACGFGAVICHHRMEAIRDAAPEAADAVCFVSHCSALFEFVCFRSVETKIGECCACTILFWYNAAMQQLHRPPVAILGSFRERGQNKSNMLYDIP